MSDSTPSGSRSDFTSVCRWARHGQVDRYDGFSRSSNGLQPARVTAHTRGIADELVPMNAG